MLSRSAASRNAVGRVEAGVSAGRDPTGQTRTVAVGSRSAALRSTRPTVPTRLFALRLCGEPQRRLALRLCGRPQRRSAFPLWRKRQRLFAFPLWRKRQRGCPRHADRGEVTGSHGRGAMAHRDLYFICGVATAPLGLPCLGASSRGSRIPLSPAVQRKAVDGVLLWAPQLPAALGPLVDGRPSASHPPKPEPAPRHPKTPPEGDPCAAPACTGAAGEVRRERGKSKRARGARG